MDSRIFWGITTWNFGEMVTVSMATYGMTIDRFVNRRLFPSAMAVTSPARPPALATKMTDLSFEKSDK
jgi:hypothetical protein